MIFEAVRGESCTGDIAIDDILLTDWTTNCPVLPGEAIPWGCNFEQDTCSWQQRKIGDNMDWIRYNGSTTSANTGPAVDHTTNTSKGYYMYIESSYPSSENDTAALVSQPLKGFANNTKKRYCMFFAYHMYGPQINKLQVKLKPEGESDSDAIWQRVGTQSPNWLHANVQLEIKKDTQVNVIY